MRVPIRQIGSSKGVLIPKAFMVQLGLEDTIELELKGDVLTLRKPVDFSRAGWAEASKKIADAGDDTLVLGEFGNEADDQLSW